MLDLNEKVLELDFIVYRLGVRTLCKIICVSQGLYIRNPVAIQRNPGYERVRGSVGTTY